ncbi:MAG TPA: TPM domain-containing protein [Pirellulales bacterium]|jgi:uncharacterized protein|nr:TPM domain-containing protein [Pirellulales bacterium]
MPLTKIARNLALVCLPLVAALLGKNVVYAQPPIPKLQQWVIDQAHVLSPDQAQRLSDLLEDKERQTSNQIAVLLIDSLQGDSIEHFANHVFNTSQIGQKHNDNGVLLVAAIQDHTMHIEVGRGLEGALTDALSAQIIRDQIAPRFKAGDYFGGLWEGILAIDQVIHGEYKAMNRPPQSHVGLNADVAKLLFYMIIFIVILASHIRFRRSRNYWFSPYWISGSSGSFSGGYSGGGFSSGGSSGGGGFSGGGGGFSGGGGSSGGGGASGSW